MRHEQAAAYAADGYARATGSVGVALTTTGPGAANTLGAVGEAWASRSPVLVIATDIPTALRRPGVYRGVLHETAGQAAMFGPVVGSSKVVWRVEELAMGAAALALWSAIDLRLPSYLEVPTDLLVADVPEVAVAAWRAEHDGPAGDQERARELIDAAERPLVWAGGRRARPRRGGGGPGRAARITRADDLRRRAGSFRPTIRAAWGCRRTSRRRAGCGTRPTWSSPSAPISTG